ncbi:MAG: histidinol-phosphate aminotransferase family protein [Methylobacteriaceae bacterium]|jgi:histidinol-phosphate aminotransferase|nr:histidinol-phosphate aminotransferase family protein [Methylobacteriaceae bacterium]
MTTNGNKPLRFKPCLIGYDKLSYVKPDIYADYRILLDCSLGVNPFGCPETVKLAAREMPFPFWSYPPHPFTSTLEAICRFWQHQARVTPDETRVYGGSMEALEVVCRAFVGEGTRVLGYLPQFADFAAAVESLGGVYQTVDMRQKPGCAFDADAFMAALTGEQSLAYIDNPNNPTGQVIPLEQLEAILKRAAGFGTAVLIDEAYADFITKEESAVSLKPEYPNLIVARTFSKGYGMAGLRIGYIIADAGVINYCEKVSSPFAVTQQAALLAEIALEDEEFLPRSRREIAAIKGGMLAGLKRLKHHVTDNRVPISALIDPAGGDLYDSLRKKGVVTEMGGDVWLDKSAVRLRVPDSLHPLLELLNG